MRESKKRSCHKRVQYWMYVLKLMKPFPLNHSNLHVHIQEKYGRLDIFVYQKKKNNNTKPKCTITVYNFYI